MNQKKIGGQGGQKERRATEAADSSEAARGHGVPFAGRNKTELLPTTSEGANQ